MAWNKIKQNLESFLCPALIGRVEYRVIGYRYLPDKSGLCYITVDKQEVLNMSVANPMVRWYQSEQEIKNDSGLPIPVSKEDMETVRKESGGTIPADRLAVVARKRKISVYAKEMMTAQAALCKTDFYQAANRFLADSIENSLESQDILMNILALVDRRVGKKRLISMADMIQLKHPSVRCFYALRCSTF